MKKGLIKSLVCAWLLTFLSGYTWAQEKSENLENKKEKSDKYDFVIGDDQDTQSDAPMNYITLVVDWGIASLLHAPTNNMALNFWRSREFGGSLYYNIPIGKSHFMASFGIGMSNADYLFKDNNILDRSRTNRKTEIKPAKNIVTGNTEIQKTMFSINYADFIGEIRFNSNKEEPQEGFFIAVGGHIGFQFLPATHIHYKEDKQNKVRITKESFNVRKYRLGMIARIGWTRFGVFYKHTLSGLFDENGPSQEAILPVSAGISINLL
ncbi:MAG: hypothetical protein BGO68_01560 [Candidatus Amoebophilus sp. 36-38]|nr:MAG: hypothetical protein BGO68_01560 [Candidatus Amoebophilus sp. 36-38]